MTEQKQTPQYTREQLEKKKKSWNRFSNCSFIGGICLALGSLIPSIPYFTPHSEEYNRYVNAQQSYNYLQRQRDEVEAPALPYENKAIQKFLELDADKTKAKALEDAIENASVEMSANLEGYNKHSSNVIYASGKVTAISLSPFILGAIGSIYGSRKQEHYDELLKKLSTEDRR